MIFLLQDVFVLLNSAVEALVDNTTKAEQITKMTEVYCGLYYDSNH